MKLPVLRHLECDIRKHCGDCRSDRDWRRDLGRFFELPGQLVDFPCPYGLPIIGPITSEKQPEFPAAPPPAPQPTPPTPEQQAEQAEQQRRVAAFAAMVQAAWRSATGQESCGTCGDSGITPVYAAWLALDPAAFWQHHEPAFRYWFAAKAQSAGVILTNQALDVAIEAAKASAIDQDVEGEEL